MDVMVEYTVQVMIRCILVQLVHIHRRMHHRVHHVHLAIGLLAEQLRVMHQLVMQVII